MITKSNETRRVDQESTGPTRSSIFSIVETFLPSATKLRRLCFYRHLSVHRGGGGVCLSAWWDTTPPIADTPLGADTPPRADTPWSRHPPRSRHPPEADTPRSRPPQEQTHPHRADPLRSRPPRSRHPPEQTPPQSRHPPRYGHCCGRYASYWNAFLYALLW